MTPFNVMSQITPMPPFNPAKKNQAVKFGKPTSVNAMTAVDLSIKGTDRTVYKIKLK